MQQSHSTSAAAPSQATHRIPSLMGPRWQPRSYGSDGSASNSNHRNDTNSGTHGRQERHVAFQLDDVADEASKREACPPKSFTKERKSLRSSRRSVTVVEHDSEYHRHVDAGSSCISDSSNTREDRGGGGTAALASWSRADVVALREFALQHLDDLSRVATGLGYEVVAQSPNRPEPATATLPTSGDSTTPNAAAVAAAGIHTESFCDGASQNVSFSPTKHNASTIANVAWQDPQREHEMRGGTERCRVEGHRLLNASRSPNRLLCEEDRFLSLESLSSATGYNVGNSNTSPASTGSAHDYLKQNEQEVGLVCGHPRAMIHSLLQPAESRESTTPPTQTTPSSSLTAAGTELLGASRRAPTSTASESAKSCPSSILRCGLVSLVSTAATTAAFDLWPGCLAIPHDSSNNSTSAPGSGGTSLAEEAGTLVMPFLGSSGTDGRGMSAGGGSPAPCSSGTALSPDASRTAFLTDHASLLVPDASKTDFMAASTTSAPGSRRVPLAASSTAETTATGTAAAAGASHTTGGTAATVASTAAWHSFSSPPDPSGYPPLDLPHASSTESTSPFTASSSAELNAGVWFRSSPGMPLPAAPRALNALNALRSLELTPSTLPLSSRNENGVLSTADAVNNPSDILSDPVSVTGTDSASALSMAAPGGGSESMSITTNASNVEGRSHRTGAHRLNPTVAVGNPAVTPTP